MTEIEQIADQAEYEAQRLIPTSDRVITSRDVAMIAARIALSAHASRVVELEGALKPFAISIKDHVPDDQVIETVAWTAGQHRAACEALKLLSAQASRVAELEGALELFVRHGRAIGAYSAEPGPFWIMTDEGHRDVPPADFIRAAKALAREDGE